MKITFISFIIIFSFKLIAQPHIDTNLIIIKRCLIISLGQDWYDEFSKCDKNKFYVKVVTDTTGKILEIPSYLLYKGISEIEFSKFCDYFVNNAKFFIYNPESEFNFDQYKSSHKFKLPYGVIFNPQKVNKIKTPIKTKLRIQSP